MKPTKAKAKRIAAIFFVAGGWGLGVSFMFDGGPFLFLLSAVNLGLGGVFTVYYTKAKK